MDSKKRHELASNELADWLSSIPGQVKAYRNQIIGAVLIIVGLVSWPILNRWRQQSDLAVQSEISQSLDSVESAKIKAVQQQQDPSSASINLFLVSANKLAEDAKKAPGNDLAAVALIKQGQALRCDLHFSKTNPSDEAITSQIKNAYNAYQEALNKAISPEIKAMAQFGLGLCLEESGQLDDAKAMYKKIVDDTAYQNFPVVVLAKKRVENFDENNQKYTFTKTAEPIPQMPSAGFQSGAAIDSAVPTMTPAPEIPFSSTPANPEQPKSTDTPATPPVENSAAAK